MQDCSPFEAGAGARNLSASCTEGTNNSEQRVSDSGADNVTQLCGDTTPRGWCSWCACFRFSVGVLLAVSSLKSPLCAPGSVTDAVPQLLQLPVSLAQLQEKPWAPAWCSSTELSPWWGGYGMDWHEGVTFVCCLLGILRFFSTSASVSVTPEWLHSSSKCRDERHVLK